MGVVFVNDRVKDNPLGFGLFGDMSDDAYVPGKCPGGHLPWWPLCCPRFSRRVGCGAGAGGYRMGDRRWV